MGWGRAGRIPNLSDVCFQKKKISPTFSGSLGLSQKIIMASMWRCAAAHAHEQNSRGLPDPIFLSFQSTAISPGRSPIGRVIPYRCVSVAHYKMFVSPDRARASDPRIDRGPLPTHRAFLSATSNDSFFRM